MKTYLSALALGAALCAGAPAFAAQAAVAPQPDAHYDKAFAFVKILNSPERVLAQARTSYFKGMHQAMEIDPRARAIESQYPGFFDELGEATYPFMEKLLLDHLPDLWASQVALLARRMTDAELDDCIAFYTSPAGLHLVDALNGAFEGKSMTADAVSQAPGQAPQFSAGGIGNDIMAAAPAAMESLSAADRNAVMAFSQTAGGRKMMAINGEVLTTLTDWTNKVVADPRLQEEVTRQAQAVMARRTKAKSK